jgi:hypothetical protein
MRRRPPHGRLVRGCGAGSRSGVLDDWHVPWEVTLQRRCARLRAPKGFANSRSRPSRDRASRRLDLLEVAIPRSAAAPHRSSCARPAAERDRVGQGMRGSGRGALRRASSLSVASVKLMDLSARPGLSPEGRAGTLPYVKAGPSPSYERRSPVRDGRRGRCRQRGAV